MLYCVLSLPIAKAGVLPKIIPGARKTKPKPGGKKMRSEMGVLWEKVVVCIPRFKPLLISMPGDCQWLIQRNALLQPSTLATLLTLLLATPLVTIMIILFGAPLTTHFAHNILCATHMALLMFQPLFYVYGVDAIIWREICSAFLPWDGVWGGTVGTAIGAWCGAIPIPLDWYVDFPFETLRGWEG